MALNERNQFRCIRPLWWRRQLHLAVKDASIGLHELPITLHHFSCLACTMQKDCMHLDYTSCEEPTKFTELLDELSDPQEECQLTS